MAYSAIASTRIKLVRGEVDLNGGVQIICVKCACVDICFVVCRVEQRRSCWS